MKFISGLILFSVLSAAVSCSRGEKVEKINLEDRRASGQVSRETIKNNEVLYFGFDLRLSPQEDARIYAPLMSYLSEKTGYAFKIRFTAGYETTQENLGKGITQFAAMGAVSFLKAKEKYGAKILVRGLNEANRGEYQAIIFTQPSSDIKNIKDIKGRSFAFGAADSTQGHLIPRKMLEDAGITLKDLKYIFTGSHRNAVEAVVDGHFDAGGAQDTLVRHMAKEGKLRILQESKYYPSSGIVVNKDVDPKIVDAVKKALLELEPKRAHKDILPDWDRTEMPNGFTEASEKDYTQINELMKRYR